MEEHRLKGMPDQYDKDLFIEIFENTEKLRDRLSGEIDLARFPGMERSDIKSWFNTKFIFAFQKYADSKSPEILKAHIINSLTLFKNRVLRKAYSKHNEAMSNAEDITELYSYEGVAVGDDEVDNLETVKLVLEFMRNQLTPPAYDLLCAQLYPPEFILHRINPTQLNRIPLQVLADYFECGVEDIGYQKREIKKAMGIAKAQFKHLV